MFQNVTLQIKLAAVVDWCKSFVKASYFKLKGDGALALQYYEIIDTITASIHAANPPNLLAVANKLSGGMPHSKQLKLQHA